MNAVEPFVHEYPATKVAPSAKVLVVRVNGTLFPVLIYQGRPCYVSATVRTRRKKGWSFFNMCVVRFLDDGSADSIPCVSFFKTAKSAPLPEAKD